MRTLEHGKIFILCLISSYIFSCTVNEKKNIKTSNYKLENKILINEVLNYIDSYNVSNSNKEVMSICVYQYEDTIIYDLSTYKSAYGLISTPSTIYLDVAGNIVALSYFGMQDVFLPDSIAWQYLKKIFPEEYAYYLKYNDYPTPPTAREIIWRLTFKGTRFLNKQEIKN